MARTANFCGTEFPADTRVVSLVNVSPTDLEPLRVLSQLVELRLIHTDPHASPIALPLDLGPIASLDQLEILELPQSGVSDLTPIAKLSRLREIDLTATRISDIRSLQNLPNLHVIRLRSTRTKHLVPFGSKLELLDIAYTQVSDLSPLNKSHDLSTLHCEGTPVADISVLVHLPQLSVLTLNETLLDSLDVVSQLNWFHNSQRLDFSGTRISALRGIENAIQVRELFLFNTSVHDLAPLSGLSKLRVLKLDHTGIEDLSPLTSLSELEVLSLAGTRVESLNPLMTLKNLRRLDLEGASVSTEELRALADALPTVEILGHKELRQ